MDEQGYIQDKWVSIRESNYIFLISSMLQFGVGIFLAIIFGVITFVVKSVNTEKYFDYFIIPVVEVVAVFLPVLVYFLLTKVDYKKVLRLKKIKLIHIFPLIIIGIGMQYVGMFLNDIVLYFLQLIGKVPTSEIFIPNNILELIFMIIIIGIFPAIFEELLARGVIMSAYSKKSVVTGILVSSIIFGVMHYDIMNFLFPVFFGLILGYVVYRTGSIFSSMIVHFVTNSFGVIILYTYKPKLTQVYEYISFSDLMQVFVVAIIAFVFILLSVFFIKKTTLPNTEILLVSDTKITIKDYWPLIITTIFLLLAFTHKISTILKIT